MGSSVKYSLTYTHGTQVRVEQFVATLDLIDITSSMKRAKISELVKYTNTKFENGLNLKMI